MLSPRLVSAPTTAAQQITATMPSWAPTAIAIVSVAGLLSALVVLLRALWSRRNRR